MKKMIKKLFGNHPEIKKGVRHDAGFKSYENSFKEIKRPCSCMEKERQRARGNNAGKKGSGIFQ